MQELPEFFVLYLAVVLLYDAVIHHKQIEADFKRCGQKGRHIVGLYEDMRKRESLVFMKTLKRELTHLLP